MTNPRPRSKSSLDLPEGSGVSLTERRFHTVARLLFLALLIAALAGVLGSGPVSSRTASSGPFLSVEYQRFTRNHAPEALRIRVVPAAASGEIRLHVNRSFVETTELTRINPEPERVEVTAQDHVYILKAQQIGREGATIIYHYRPQAAFRDVPVRIAIPGAPPVRFTQFVYP